MKISNETIEWRIYFQPLIERIKLDNEISLALESAPPNGPSEASKLSPEHFDMNPFKSEVG
jgi:hypothetical protein